MNGFDDLFTNPQTCYNEMSCEVKLEYQNGTIVTN